MVLDHAVEAVPGNHGVQVVRRGVAILDLLPEVRTVRRPSRGAVSGKPRCRKQGDEGDAHQAVHQGSLHAPIVQPAQRPHPIAQSTQPTSPRTLHTHATIQCLPRSGPFKPEGGRGTNRCNNLKNAMGGTDECDILADYDTNKVGESS